MASNLDFQGAIRDVHDPVSHALQVKGNADSNQATMGDVLAALKYLTNFLARPMWQKVATGALRITPETSAGVADTLSTITTVTTVTTVTAVTSLTNITGYSGKDTLLNSLDRSLWYNSVRARIV